MIRQICDMLGEDVIVVGRTGYINQELFAYRDFPDYLYLVGSMVGAPSVELGLASHLPDTCKVIV